MEKKLKYWVENDSSENHTLELLEINYINNVSHPIVRVIECDNVVRIEEACDNYFSREFTKEEAIEALQEVIDWLKNHRQ